MTVSRFRRRRGYTHNGLVVGIFFSIGFLAGLVWLITFIEKITR